MLDSRLPQVIADAERRSRAAVERAGKATEFKARKHARKDTGDMAAGIVYRPGRNGMSGRVLGTDFKTRWHEFGTVNMSAQPMFTPAAEDERPLFLADMARVYS